MVNPTDMGQLSATDEFRRARDFLIAERENYEDAVKTFRWPEVREFNWAWDWFDHVARTTDRTALWIVDENGDELKLSYPELSVASKRFASWLLELGAEKNQRIIVMLENQAELWVVFLAAMRIGLIVIPCSPLITGSDLKDRVDRGGASYIVATSEIAQKVGDAHGELTRIAMGAQVSGWLPYGDYDGRRELASPVGPTNADDPLIWYFTSGTTAQPKLVEHTHASYPIGHLSTMYWIGLEPGDVHMNIASPGWAKHAWSSFFAPFNAEATVLVYRYARFDASTMLDVTARCGVTSMCAPPTVWRMLIQSDLSKGRASAPRKLISAGEPLNPEIISHIESVWGVQIRDGFGQTECTAAIGNSPGQPIVPGSMGRPLPGYTIRIVDPITGEPASEGEVCIDMSPRPTGLMVGYGDDPVRNAEVFRDRLYHLGDIATVDQQGYITFVGRTDDVFKSSDYRISPFELESALMEHPAVAEVAVVPAPDPIRLVVPKAIVMLANGFTPSREVADELFAFARDRLAPYKRIRIIEFGNLPKTVSGKIRRTELRQLELDRGGQPQPNVFQEKR